MLAVKLQKPPEGLYSGLLQLAGGAPRKDETRRVVMSQHYTRWLTHYTSVLGLTNVVHVVVVG